MIFITNFTVSRALSDIKAAFDDFGKTNIDYMLDDLVDGQTNWSVPKNAAPGDIIVFMCTKTARNNIGLATSHIPTSYGQAFNAFVAQQNMLYKNTAAACLAVGLFSTRSYEDLR